MPKLKSLNCMCYRWEVVHELREQLPDVSVNGYPPMATVCKMKKIRYVDFFIIKDLNMKLIMIFGLHLLQICLILIKNKFYLHLESQLLLIFVFFQASVKKIQWPMKKTVMRI